MAESASAIATTTTATGFAIKFPFALKEAFREAFPSAKWNSIAKQWEVGPRSGKRLEQWVAAVADVAAEIVAADERELTEREIDKLLVNLQDVRTAIAAKVKRIEALGDAKARYADALAQLAANKERLAAVKAQAVDAEQAAEREANAVYAQLGEVIDWRVIDTAMIEMARWHQKVGQTAHSKFDEAQALIIEQRKLLREAGFGTSGLDWLAGANFNRADRDAVHLMPSGAMLKVYKHEE